MSESTTHYEALGVAEDASEKQVKAAFYKKVRQHPPEQDPDGYKAIREAYDVLSNPVARKEYDNMAKHGDKITKLEDEAETLLQEDPPEIDEAVRKLKKAILLGPEIGLLRNKLGNAYYMNGNFSKSLKQFEKAVEIDESNPAYRLDKGYALRELGRVTSAERIFRDVWIEDQGDYAAARALASVLYTQDKTDKAHEVLDKAIWHKGEPDFEDFFCYLDKLKYYAFSHNIGKLEKELDKASKLPENQDDKNFVAFMFAKTSDFLRDENAFALAHRFVEAAEKLSDESMELEDITQQDLELRRHEEQIDSILNDDDIHPAVRNMSLVYYNRYVGAIGDFEFDEQIEEAVNLVDNVLNLREEGKEVKGSCKKIKNRYAKIYSINKNIYDDIIGCPIGNQHLIDCPHCAESYQAPINGNYDWIECPYCEGASDSQGNPTTAGASGGCFVATAVYGDYDHPDVMRLRAFRDVILQPTSPGRAFIALYYRYGPHLADSIKGYPMVKNGVRWTLEQVVRRWLR